MEGWVTTLPAEITTTPLTLLRAEANQRDRQAQEALFLTFGCDLGFFESQVLGTARGTGAAVTLIADAHVYDPDPRAVRAAGISYCVGLASMPAVFHPKLTVLAGPKRAVVAIGSGNLSVGGWHLNCEVLTVASGDRDSGCPPILRQVAQWLQDLSDSKTVVLGSTARRGLTRTVAQLFSLCDNAPALHHQASLLGNLNESIIDQLPVGETDGLRVFAPFHDLDGHALDRLLSRFLPTWVEIAIQERFTVVDPLALMAVGEKHGVDIRFRQDKATSYRHGKIIEAHRGGSLLWSLAGSPNLSRQALTRSVLDGGNCELAVLDYSGPVLFPPTTGPIADTDLVAVRTGPPAIEEEPARGRPNDGLLEAVLEGHRIRLSFARTLGDQRSIEVSPYSSDPDQFIRVGVLEPGRSDYFIHANPEWDYPLRLRVRIDGSPAPVHFVVRPDQITLRASGRGSVRTPDVSPEEIFTDDTQAREWLAAVTQLALDIPPALRTVRPRDGAEEEEVRETIEARGGLSWDDPAAWHVYLDEAAQRMGEPMVSFALGGLPRISFASRRGRAEWEDDFVKRADDSASDEPAGMGEDGDDMQESDDLQRDYGEVERQRYRRWLGRLVQPPAGTAAIDRAVRARLMLRATRMKLWEQDADLGWFDLLLTAARTLPGDDIPPQYLSDISALAQVIAYELAMAAQEMGMSHDVEHSAMRAYLEVERELADLMQPVDRSLLQTYADTLRAKLRVPPDAELIAEHVAQALSSDATEQALRQLLLIHPELDVRSQGGRVIEVLTRHRSPLLGACLCMEALEGDWAVFASSENGHTAFAARADSTLTVAMPASANTKVRYRSYALSALVTPARVAVADDKPLERVTAAEKPPLDLPGASGAGVLSRLRIDPHNVKVFLCPHAIDPRCSGSGSLQGK